MTGAYLPRAFRLAFPKSLAPESRLVLVLSDLEGYFDESGLHEGSLAISVAGYVSTAPLWELFEIKWRECLDEWGLDFFHMTDFAVGAPPYDKWTKEQKWARFAKLTQIIFDHVLASVSYCVLKDRYDELMPERAKFMTDGPYGLLASCCFMDVGELLRPQYPSMRVAYVFEDGARGKGQVIKVYDSNKQDPVQSEKMKLLSLRFESKKEFLPLQAADILAYELHKHLPRQEGIDPRAPRLQHMTMLGRVALKRWGFIDDDQINVFASVLIHASRDFKLEE